MSERAKELYYLKWLPKIRRALAPSGRLSELAHTLAGESGESTHDWHTRLRMILTGHELARPDLVFRIDRFLSRPAPTPAEASPELPWSG
jgi:hypothetical protein